MILCALVKKNGMNIRVLILLIFLFISIVGMTSCSSPQDHAKFGCSEHSDCVSTCGSGCVNTKWAGSYKDPCVNVRAFDCSCDTNICYTDGKAP